MSWVKYLDAAKKILAAIEEHGPRDDVNELMHPYFSWAKRLRDEIQRAEAWSKVTKEVSCVPKEAP